MAAWMLYLTVVGCAMGGAGLLAERGLRRLGRPVRWAWVAALAATVGLPMVRVLAGRSPAPSLWSGIPAGMGSPTLDGVLLMAWAATSLVLLASLRLSSWTLRRNRRSWSTQRVDGHAVLASAAFGPGVIGASRPRIVLPRWVLDSDPALTRLVVMHELEHVRARDSRLLLGGLLLAMLMPWCLPLWWQLHRLHGAVEFDCDARVLAAGAAPHGYASALVAVAGRRHHRRLPVPALAPTPAELERRIRWITAEMPEPSNRAGLGRLAAALVVLAVLAIVPAPDAPDLTFAAATPATADFPPGATVILSVGEPDSD